MRTFVIVSVFLLIVVVSYSLVNARLFCFRRVKRGNRCGGYMRKARYSSPEECCSGKGQGFAERKVKIGRNRFRCVPCLGLVGTGGDKKSLPKTVTFEPRPSDSGQPQTTRPDFTKESTTAFYWPTPAGREFAVGNPFPLPRDKDGNVIVWEEWSPCSVTCGAGWRSRAKVCDDCDRNDYENVQSQPCMDNFYCPVDGNWGPWYPWEACSTSCGQGSRSRRRKCNYPPPAYGGASCEGDALALKDCMKDDCPMNGAWSAWSEFSSCSETCGSGIMTRTRQCDLPAPTKGGQPCQGDSTHTQNCDLGPCPVDGSWSQWSKWTPCSVTCDSGTIERSRLCDDPVPQNGGRPCEGESTQQQFCYTTRPCPVDGGWTEWADYGPCRAPSCGRGFQIRSRSCTAPRPAHRGQKCEGHQYKRATCFSQRTCPKRDGEFCQWSAWNSCSASCKEDTPLQGRQRVCACPTPRHGGRVCQGEMFQVKECENITYCFPPLEADIPIVIEADITRIVDLKDKTSKFGESSNMTTKQAKQRVFNQDEIQESGSKPVDDSLDSLSDKEMSANSDTDSKIIDPGNTKNNNNRHNSELETEMTVDKEHKATVFIDKEEILHSENGDQKTTYKQSEINASISSSSSSPKMETEHSVDISTNEDDRDEEINFSREKENFEDKGLPSKENVPPNDDNNDQPQELVDGKGLSHNSSKGPFKTHSFQPQRIRILLNTPTKTPAKHFPEDDNVKKNKRPRAKNKKLN